VQLEQALDYAREGDTFVVTKLDRLARSVANLVDELHGFADGNVTARGAARRDVNASDASDASDGEDHKRVGSGRFDHAGRDPQIDGI
jgi:hypothetical protein